MTFLRLLKLFFVDVLVDHIFAYTKLYSHREKAHISFEIPYKKIRFFSSMILLSGCHKLPDRKMYCEATPDTIVQIRSDSMFRYTFEQSLRNLHLCDNEVLDK